jgi:hypothetical protein
VNKPPPRPPPLPPRARTPAVAPPEPGAKAHNAPPPAADRAQIEIELISNLKQVLSRLFRAGELSSTVERKIAEAGKRFARLGDWRARLRAA